MFALTVSLGMSRPDRSEAPPTHTWRGLLFSYSPRGADQVTDTRMPKVCGQLRQPVTTRAHIVHMASSTS
jgi:hypothetical protein